eukprot:1159247-Pelagomonas_calceolata.AAC.3
MEIRMSSPYLAALRFPSKRLACMMAVSERTELNAVFFRQVKNYFFLLQCAFPHLFLLRVLLSSIADAEALRRRTSLCKVLANLVSLQVAHAGRQEPLVAGESGEGRQSMLTYAQPLSRTPRNPQQTL